MDPVIQLDRVTKTYRSGSVEVCAVREVSVAIERGEFVAILGASGSGKSTLMNLVGCLDRPTSGVYRLDGIDVSAMSPDQLAGVRNRKLGFIFQGFNLLPRTTALENVELPLLYAHPAPLSRERRERARDMLKRVGLGDRMDHVPSQLSGGQQQRVAIARALVAGPSLLLADEPTGNLDSRTSVEIMDLFQHLNDDGISIVMVTHEPDIARFTKRNIHMRDGRIVRDAPVGDRLTAAAALAAIGTDPAAREGPT